MQHQLHHTLKTALPGNFVTLANLGALECGLTIKSHVTTLHDSVLTMAATLCLSVQAQHALLCLCVRRQDKGIDCLCS